MVGMSQQDCSDDSIYSSVYLLLLIAVIKCLQLRMYLLVESVCIVCHQYALCGFDNGVTPIIQYTLTSNRHHLSYDDCLENNPLTSNRHHLSYDDCLENKGRLQDCSCSIGSYHCIQCYAHIL